MKKIIWSATGLLAVMASAEAQDSVSKVTCKPGDAISPWSDANSVNGSEQVNTYVVDLSDLTTSWGTPFGIAPIAKASVANTNFFNNLMNAQAMSRVMMRNKPFAASSYAYWNAPGFGVNNDPALNDAPTNINTATKKGVQFAASFAEFETNPTNVDYAGIVTSVVNIDPNQPTRLYVKRVQTAISSCGPTAELAVYGLGGVDANGNTTFRADANGVTTGGCGLTTLSGNNIFLVDALARAAGALNITSNDYPAGQFDAAATKWVLRNSTTSHNTPTILPEEVTGGAPVVLASNFNNQFVRGTDFPTTADGSHLPAGVTVHRGNISYMAKNFGLLNSTHGVAAMLGHTALGDAQYILLFGLDASGNVTGTKAVTLPAAIVDATTGFTNIGQGINEFDHYHSQVAFGGGNGQVALNIDAQGNLLVAAEVVQPTFVGANQDDNYIGVCRIDPTNGNETWTMAGYIDSATFSGKPILSGPSGTPIGFMLPYSQLGQLAIGPSVSAPMIDGAGNVWFLSSANIFGGNKIGLLRAVYNPTAFTYELELVASSEDIFIGQNSGLPWVLRGLTITDSNSVSSGTAWSNNISESGALGIDGSCFDPVDPRSTGGVILSAQVVYDSNLDGQFVPCDPTVQPQSNDESYRVLLFIGPKDGVGVTNYGQGCAGSAGIVPTLTFDGLPKSNKNVTLTIEGGIGGSQALVFLGLTQGSIPIPGLCHLLVSPILPVSLTLPLFGAPVPGGGSISIPAVLPTVPPGVQITMQALCLDPGVFWGFSATQGVQLNFQ